MSRNYFSENLAVLWDNVEKYGATRQATDDSIIWRMLFVYQSHLRAFEYKHGIAVYVFLFDSF